MKKIIFLFVLIGLIGITCCFGYGYYKDMAVIDNLKNSINDNKFVQSDYQSIYKELEVETNNSLSQEIINDTISNIKKNINNNMPTIKELSIELETLKKKNIELERQIAQINELKENNKDTKILDKRITYSQFPEYPTGCESVALYILLKYHNVDVTVEDIVGSLKKGELPYSAGGKTYGGNPEVEFIGNPTSRYSYGAYNDPMANVANKFKSGIQNKKGLDLNSALEIVKSGRPVMAWTTIGLSKPYISTSWIYRPTGETIKWISGEHAVVIIGYNNSQIIVSDPYTGTIRYWDRELFESRYDYLGKRVLYY